MYIYILYVCMYVCMYVNKHTECWQPIHGTAPCGTALPPLCMEQQRPASPRICPPTLQATSHTWHPRWDTRPQRHKHKEHQNANILQQKLTTIFMGPLVFPPLQNNDPKSLRNIIHSAHLRVVWWGARLVINRSWVRLPSTVLSGASLSKLFTHVHLSPSSINLIPAQGGEVTVGLASHWSCVTDNNGNSI